MRLHIAICLSMVLVAGTDLSAQSRLHAGRGGFRHSHPQRMTGFGGVRSQAPRGIATPIRVQPTHVHHHGQNHAGPGHGGAGRHGPRHSGFPGTGNAGRGTPVMGGNGDRGFGDRGFNNPITSHAGQHPSRPSGDFVAAHVGNHRGSHFHAPVIGDGLTVAGAYSDGPWKVVFSVGGAAGFNHHSNDCVVLPVFNGACGVYPYWPVGSFYDGYGVAFGYSSYYDDYNYSRPVIGEPAPAPAPAAEAPAPMTAQENAASLLRYGDAKGAIRAYQAILKQQPNDAESMRGLGLALIDNGQAGDGIAVIGMAYRSDATLGPYPVPRNAFGKHSDLRGILNRVSTYANREKSASAWLTLAVLMQAEERYGQALAMVERAKAAGLEEQIVQEMTAALAPLDSQVR